MNVLLSEKDAYKAMIKFLEAYYERGKSDDIAVLLGSMMLLEDSSTADSAMWKDWMKTVDAVGKL